MPKNNTAKRMLCIEAVKQWEELSTEVLNNLILSMPNRLKAVIEAQGWYTKY